MTITGENLKSPSLRLRRLGLSARNVVRAALGLLLVVAFGDSTAKARELTLNEIYQLTLRSTVLLASERDGGGASIGSGAIVDARHGLIVTANHVVDGGDKVLVFFPMFDQRGHLVTDLAGYQGAGHLANVIVRRPRQDLALLQLRTLPEAVTSSIAIARTSITPGLHVSTIGNSGVDKGVLWRFSTGIVRQVFTMRGEGLDARMIEMQMPINGGDSGGPIVNSLGELVGINHAAHDEQALVEYGVELDEIKALIAGSGAFIKVFTPEQNEFVVGPNGCCVHYHVFSRGRVVATEWIYVSRDGEQPRGRFKQVAQR